MSRTPIRCPSCKTPLAEKVPSGPVDVLIQAITAQRLHGDRTVLTCKACGTKHTVRFVIPKMPRAA